MTDWQLYALLVVAILHFAVYATTAYVQALQIRSSERLLREQKRREILSTRHYVRQIVNLRRGFNHERSLRLYQEFQKPNNDGEFTDAISRIQINYNSPGHE